MFQALTSFIARFLGAAATPALKDSGALAYGASMCDYLCLSVYDHETESYHSGDGSHGWIWQCRDWILGEGGEQSNAEALLRVGVSDYTVLGFIRHVDVEGSRLVVTLTIPPAATQVDPEVVKGQVLARLQGMGLEPENMAPPVLLGWLRHLLNDDHPTETTPEGGCLSRLYDESKFINKQIILSGTKIATDAPYLHIGNRCWRVLSPKGYPERLVPAGGAVAGATWRAMHGRDRTPSLYAVNVIFDNVRVHYAEEGDHLEQKEGIEKLAEKLKRPPEEVKWTLDKIHKDEPLARVMVFHCFMGESRETVDASISTGRDAWETRHFLMQEHSHMPLPSFLCALPMGVRVNEILEKMEADEPADGFTILNLLPIQYTEA